MNKIVKTIYNKQKYIHQIYILFLLLAHLTSIKIDDDDYSFISKYSLKFKEIFKLGIKQIKIEMLDECKQELEKTKEKVYTLEKKYIQLSNENIYNSQKIYTIDDVLNEYIQVKRFEYSDSQNLIWLQPRMKKLSASGCAKTIDSVLEYCKNNHNQKNKEVSKK